MTYRSLPRLPPPPQPLVEITVMCPCFVLPAGVVTCVLVLAGQACALCVWILSVYGDLLTWFCNAVLLCELLSTGSLVSSKLGEKIDLWIFVVYVSFFWSKWSQETTWFLHTLYMLYCNKWGLASLFVSVCVHHTCYFAMSGACLFISVCLSLTCCWTLLLWLMLGGSIKEGEKVCCFSLTLFISINCARWEMGMQLSLRVCTLSHSSGSCTRSSRVIIT